MPIFVQTLTMIYISINTPEKKEKINAVAAMIENSISAQKKFKKRVSAKKPVIISRKEVINYFKKRAQEDDMIKNKFRKIFKEYYTRPVAPSKRMSDTI